MELNVKQLLKLLSVAFSTCRLVVKRKAARIKTRNPVGVVNSKKPSWGNKNPVGEIKNPVGEIKTQLAK
jgi:hypothetical protein